MKDQVATASKSPLQTQKNNDRIRHDHNPFLDEAARSPSKESINGTTRIDGCLTKSVSTDEDDFINLHAEQIGVFFDLNSASRKVVRYLIHSHQQNRTEKRITLHPDYVNEDGFSISKSAWYDGINELVEKNLIAHAKARNDYYLNPAIFFSDDGVRFVVELSIA